MDLGFRVGGFVEMHAGGFIAACTFFVRCYAVCRGRYQVKLKQGVALPKLWHRNWAPSLTNFRRALPSYQMCVCVCVCVICMCVYIYIYIHVCMHAWRDGWMY